MIAMAAHFLLSPLCRTLSVAEVARMSEDEAWRAFCRIRWAATGGDPVCPRCQGLVHYARLARRKWICKSCGYEFSVTAGTILADRKMSFGDLLLAIFLFVNAVKGLPALQLSREVGCDYKVAFVLLHKLRECLEAEQARHLLGGEGTECETDTAYFGGYGKPANHQENRRDLRLAENRTGRRQCVVVVRQRDGGTSTAVIPGEAAAPAFVRRKVARGGVIHADEGAAFDELHARYVMARINHEEAYSRDGACTNQAESFFSRMRRAEVGIHHHIAGLYLRRYAAEMSWREDRQVTDNSRLTSEVVALTLGRGHSVDWRGYWRRWQHAA
jgi:transposase-like protein